MMTWTTACKRFRSVSAEATSRTREEKAAAAAAEEEEEEEEAVEVEEKTEVKGTRAKFAVSVGELDLFQASNHRGGLVAMWMILTI